MKSETVVSGRRQMEPAVLRSADSAVSVLIGRLYATSMASVDLDSDERRTLEDASFSNQRSLLVEWLVQLFVIGTRYVPQAAQRLLEPGDLPPALERVAMQAQRCLQTWFAWTAGPRTWFVVAEMTTAPSRHRQESALRMYFYDEDGRFVSWGTWALHAGGWILCER